MSDRFKKFVEKIANQNTSIELIIESENEDESHDFESAYDSFIAEARELLL